MPHKIILETVQSFLPDPNLFNLIWSIYLPNLICLILTASSAQPTQSDLPYLFCPTNPIWSALSLLPNQPILISLISSAQPAQSLISSTLSIFPNPIYLIGSAWPFLPNSSKSNLLDLFYLILPNSICQILSAHSIFPIPICPIWSGWSICPSCQIWSIHLSPNWCTCPDQTIQLTCHCP